MASLGIKTYRLSSPGPRIYPQGDGELNQAWPSTAASSPA